MAAIVLVSHENGVSLHPNFYQMNDLIIEVGDLVKLKNSIDPNMTDAMRVEQINEGKAGCRVSTGFGVTTITWISLDQLYKVYS